MMKILVLFIAMAFAACNSVHSNANNSAHNATAPASAHVAQQSDSVRRITTAELDELMKQGKVVVVDVRTQQSYDAGHIRGAKLIPVTQVRERSKELPRDKTIVTYCS